MCMLNSHIYKYIFFFALPLVELEKLISSKRLYMRWKSLGFIERFCAKE